MDNPYKSLKLLPLSEGQWAASHSRNKTAFDLRQRHSCHLLLLRGVLIPPLRLSVRGQSSLLFTGSVEEFVALPISHACSCGFLRKYSTAPGSLLLARLDDGSARICPVHNFWLTLPGVVDLSSW